MIWEGVKVEVDEIVGKVTWVRELRHSPALQARPRASAPTARSTLHATTRSRVE